MHRGVGPERVAPIILASSVEVTDAGNATSQIALGASEPEQVKRITLVTAVDPTEEGNARTAAMRDELLSAQ